MSKKVARPDRGDREGHGEDGPKPSVSKGTFIPIGTAAPAIGEGISANKKSGPPYGHSDGG